MCCHWLFQKRDCDQRLPYCKYVQSVFISCVCKLRDYPGWIPTLVCRRAVAYIIRCTFACARRSCALAAWWITFDARADSCRPDVLRAVTSESHLLFLWAADIRTRLIHRPWPLEPLTLQLSYWSIKVMKEHGSMRRCQHGRNSVQLGGFLRFHSSDVELDLHSGDAAL